jgi:hypothetical protein
MSVPLNTMGYTTAEVEALMGGPMPLDDPAQRRAYALLAMKRLREHDEARYNGARLLLVGPDDLVDEWQAIAHENALRLNPRREPPPKAP